jgi:aminopeptidase N
MGYVRTLYDAGMFAELAAHASESSALDQLGLLNDAWAFALSGEAPASNVLKLVEVIRADGNPVVWKRVVDILEEIDRRYALGPRRDGFHRFALRLLRPLALQLGKPEAESDSSNVEILRSRLQEAQARFGDPDVIAEARKRFDTGQGTPAQLRTAVNIVAAHADAPMFARLLSRAQGTADPLEKLYLFTALTKVTDPTLARRMIGILMGAQVPAGANASLITVLAHEHPDLVWQELASRLDDPQLPLTKRQRWSVAAEVAGASSNMQRIADLEAYEERSVPRDARKPFLGAVASIRRNQRLEGGVLPDMDRWISARTTRANEHGPV